MPTLLLVLAAVLRADQTPRDTITIFAASDLTLAFAELAPAFERERRVSVRVVYGSTGNLVLQARHGAPADALFSANVAFIDQLRADSLTVAGSEQLYARGRIVLATRKGSGIQVTRLAELLDPKIRRVAVANPDHAPYGLAAKQALIHEAIWDRLERKIVFGENIRQTLQYLQSGSVDAAIVALSIADLPDIRYTMVPEDFYPPLNQAAAVLRRARHPAEAKEFIAFVLGPAGQQVMQRFGFVAPR